MNQFEEFEEFETLSSTPDEAKSYILKVEHEESTKVGYLNIEDEQALEDIAVTFTVFFGYPIYSGELKEIPVGGIYIDQEGFMVTRIK